MFASKHVVMFPKLARLKTTVTNVFVNRNPRNLEQMRIARKPDGYHLDKPGRKFWHKLVLSSSSRTVKAEVIHFVNGPVITVKTSEQALCNQLYSITDTCAYINLGKVFAQRCLECGITEMHCDIEPLKGGKVEKFLEKVVEGGILLKEMEVYSKPKPWDLYRPEKPWEVNAEE